MAGKNHMKSYNYSYIAPIAELILTRTRHRPKIGLICGSGLGSIASYVTEQEVVSYSSIPNFPQSTVSGHEGNFIFGILGGKTVMLMQGRLHIFEGYTPQECTIPIRVMKLLGVDTIMITNASGCLNGRYQNGDIMIVRDHINIPGLTGLNPLVGENDPKFGPRFVAMSNAYDPGLIKLAQECAKSLGYADQIHEGIYAMLLGPTFESVAESRMLKAVGADVVGMSTCPEVLVARHCSMKVFAMSVITNPVIQEYDVEERVEHDDVLEVGRRSAKIVQGILDKMIEQMTVD